MGTVRIDIEPEVILDVISKSGRSLDDVKTRFKSFDKWITKEVNPTFNQLIDLSIYLRMPFGYLLLKSPVKEEISLLKFRTIDSEAILKPSRELIDTINDMKYKQEWLRNILIEDGYKKLSFVGIFSQKNNMNFKEMAEIIRETIGLKKNWFEDADGKNPTFSILREKISQIGIVVMQNGIALNNTHRPLDLNEFRAFTLIDEYVPFIFINNRDSNSGKTFSLLHELVHIFFGRDSLYNDDLRFRNKYNSPIEVICNKIAGEIIVPTDIFVKEWKRNQYQLEDNGKIAILADKFKVSKIVIARKALDQGYINQKKYDEITDIAIKEFNLSRKKKQSSQGGGSLINNALSRLDRNFLKTLIQSVEHGEIQYTDAYRIAGVGRGVFEEIAERLRGV